MKTILLKSQLILLMVLFITSGHTMARDGNELITAVAYQDLDKIKNLVDAGVDINFQEESAGTTALIMSSMFNFEDIARYLMENGANVNASAANGKTPLSLAKEEDDREMVILLEQLGGK